MTLSIRQRVVTVVGMGAVAAVAMSGCTASASGAGEALLTIPREDMGTFSQNFNPFSPTAAPMTQQAIYESMLVFSPNDGTTTPSFENVK